MQLEGERELILVFFSVEMPCWNLNLIFLSFSGGTETETETATSGWETGTMTGIKTETGTEMWSHSVEVFLNRTLYSSRSTRSPTCPTRRVTMRSWRRGYSCQSGSTERTSLTFSCKTSLLCWWGRQALGKPHRWKAECFCSTVTLRCAFGAVYILNVIIDLDN